MKLLKARGKRRLIRYFLRRCGKTWRTIETPLPAKKTYKLGERVPQFFDAASKVQNNSVLFTLGMYGITNSFNIWRFEKIGREALGVVAEKPWYRKAMHAMSAARESLPFFYALGLIIPLKDGVKVDKMFE